MTRTTKRLAVATLFIALVMSIALAVGTFFTAPVSAVSESATIETFDMSGASVRTNAPTGVRFVTKVNKTYRDTTLSGQNYEFGTLIIPVDVFEKSQESELNHKVADVMDVKQTTWGEDVDGYYVFNAVLMNMPDTEYGRALMARSYVKINGGEPVYSETTITRTIAQVASTIIAKYPNADEELLNTYVDAVAKSVAFDSDTLNLDVNQTATLSVTTNPANYDVIYSVDDDSVVSVDWQGNVKGLKPGVAMVYATFGTYSDSIEVVVNEPTAQWGSMAIAANNTNLSLENGIYRLEVITNPVIRLYANALSNYNAGDIVNVKITYKLTGATKDYCFYGPTASGVPGLLPARDTLVNTGEQHSITIKSIVSNTDGAVSGDNTSGSNKNNIALALWVGVGSVFEIIDVEIISTWGGVETVAGTATQTLENGNLKIVAVNSNPDYRFYLNELSSYTAGSAISVKITYKISNLQGGTKDLAIYAPNQAGTLAVVVAKGALVADGSEHSITYNTVVSNTAGAMTATNTGGTNANNIVLNPWIDNKGYILEISDIAVVSPSWGIVETVAGTATQTLENGNYKIVTTDNATYRFYLNELSSYTAGSAVSVNITYKISNLQGGTKDLAIYAPNHTSALAVVASGLVADGSEHSVTYNTVVSNTAGVMSATNTGGTNAKNIVLNPWIDDAGYTLEICDITVVLPSWGIVETVAGNATQTLENGNLKIVTTNNATYRFYLNELSSYTAGSAISVKITYKISNLQGTVKDLGIYAPNQAGTLAVVVAKGALVADGGEHSITYNTVVSNTAGAMNATNTGGTNVNNIVLNPWIANGGYILEICDITVSPV